MKIFHTLLATLLCFTNTYVQHITQSSPQRLSRSEIITERAELEQTLRQHFLKTVEALVEEFNYKEKGKILKYLPSLGYNFIIQSPHLSYNTGALYAAINDQYIKEVKIRSIRRYIELTLQAELEKLHKL